MHENMSQASAAFGVVLEMGDGALDEQFTAVAEIRDVSGPDLDHDEEEVTHHQSPGGFEEVIMTIKRTGEVTFEVNWIPNHPSHNINTGLLAAWRQRQLRHWRITYPDAGETVWAFAAWVKGMSGEANVAGVLRQNITLRVTGEIDLDHEINGEE